ncbi:MAG: 7,8-didemethyl-8-hydroxy-5-deazariboflavin synthase CofG [Deltaproteobacteria bacterium]|nr:7,8-didemethyl-8-hydroxy-5-deazariboflavin synthase CofG [Deltaproteobacteria bacterium]
MSGFNHQASLPRAEAEQIVGSAVDAGQLERRPAERLAAQLGDPIVREVVLEGAAESKRRGKGDIVSVSRNVFIPLTNLCRNRCAYCTFAKLPGSPEAKTYTLREVEEAVRVAVSLGCCEALLCLGDKPEIAYHSYREWLAHNELRDTTDYLVRACRIAFEGGILPHTNAGILSESEMAELRPWNASMGLMLESTSARLRQKDMAHYYSPDKDPDLRIRMHEQAGQLQIPFTSGILLGIGESAVERVDTLLAIRELDDRYGHIQEAIVQPFHPKTDTPMAATGSISDEEVAAWVAIARLILGPEMNVQAPPNLASSALELLLRSGLNDWGGISPVTVDFINPEAPWPELEALRKRTEAAGQRLVERLPVYPAYLLDRPDFFEPRIREAALERADLSGFARTRATGTGVEAA